MVRLPLSLCQAWLIAVVAGGMAADSGETREHTYTGYAYATDRDVLLYVEEHRELWSADLLEHNVTYRDPEEGIIVEKEIDYTASEVAPSFVARDLRSGRIEGAEVGARRLELTRGEGETRSLRKPDDLVVDAGFNRFILRHWDALTAGKRLRLAFAAPALFRCIDFVVFAQRRLEIAGQSAYVFRMRTDSLLFRLFTEPIDVSYCAETKRLLAYEGLTNIRNDRGENLEARIVFPEPGEDPLTYLASM